jgi:hypothetical protein
LKRQYYRPTRISVAGLCLARVTAGHRQGAVHLRFTAGLDLTPITGRHRLTGIAIAQAGHMRRRLMSKHSHERVLSAFNWSVMSTASVPDTHK